LYQRRPEQVKLILIDPKIVELKLYNDIPHLLTPVITEPKRAFQALQYCIAEMERRYSCLDSMGVRDIKSYNKRIKEKNMATESLPYIVIIIDEFADLIATTGKELESTVARLAAMSRAVGIHLVLATQRPSINVITGLIKANIPSRIAFMVSSMMDSRIIIDQPGAEKLLGKGDMLYSGVVDPFPVRMQGAFVSDDEVERVVDYVKTLGEPEYIDEEIFIDDEDDDSVVEDLHLKGQSRVLTQIEKHGPKLGYGINALRTKMLRAQREVVVAERDAGRLNETVMRRMLRELDLEEEAMAASWTARV
jgi:S-DNA-T family DNA segregation ATPase FtsK/SpoIIIE